MKLLPAIDLRRGKCVRLRQGRDDTVTVYGDDPVAVAKEFVQQGATWLHIVNLDGAFGRASDNLAIVDTIARTCNVDVEFGGGLRSLADVAAAAKTGAQKLVVGTVAFTDEHMLREVLRTYGSERIVVAIDAVKGLVATQGWTKSTGVSVKDAARRMQDFGVKEVLYTDVSRDGMMGGPDLETMREIIAMTSLDVIASGGVSSLEDLRKLKALNTARVTGVIVGKALYEGAVTIPEMLKVFSTP